MAEFRLTWADLAEIARLGLGIMLVERTEEAGTTIYGMPTAEALAEMERRDMDAKKKNYGLAGRLKSLYEAATFKPGIVQRLPDLGSGLGVDVLVGLDGAIRLQIYRHGVQPSESEWNTILKYFPVGGTVESKKTFLVGGKWWYTQGKLVVESGEGRGESGEGRVERGEGRVER